MDFALNHQDYSSPRGTTRFERVAVRIAALWTLLLLMGFPAIGVAEAPNLSLPGKAPDTAGIDRLDSAEVETLRFMHEGERLARDLHLYLHDLWSVPAFSYIAAAKQRHMDELREVMERYGVDDPARDDQVGVFDAPGLADLYRQSIADAAAGPRQALRAAALVEELDILELRNALSNSRRLPLALTYNALLSSTHNHLQGLVRLLRGQGGVYQAQAMEEAQVAAVLNNGWVSPDMPLISLNDSP